MGILLQRAGSTSTHGHPCSQMGIAAEPWVQSELGLDPRIAGLMLVVDLMLNAGDIVSMGLLVPFSVAAGVVLGYITYKAQMNWYGDDKESAKIKGIVVALLTAIPTPLPAILYVPAGILGVLRNARRKLART